MTQHRNGYEDEIDDPNPAEVIISEDRAETWIKLAYRIMILAIVVLSGVYAVSPVDAIPDILIGPGQLDDIAAVTAGGGSIGILTILRFLFLAGIRHPQVRRGCLLALVVGGIIILGSTIFLFFTLARLFQSL